MHFSVRTSNQAELDIAEAAEYLSRDSIDTALRFVDAVDQTADLLAANPLLGEAYTHPRFASLRFRPLTGFRSHLVFYQVQADGILIIRVLQGSRDLPEVLSGDS
ncbi:MAG: type II toxin-antitoxin system RelE/ParE family toxin [Planctomycetota bacterium]